MFCIVPFFVCIFVEKILTNHQKNIATFIHLSTFSRFIFPLGNFLDPVILWALNKDKSEFIDEHGKQAVNFQLSMLLYAIIAGVISIPFLGFYIFKGFSFKNFSHFEFNINNTFSLLMIGGGLGVITVLIFILEVIFVIKASLKAKDGLEYKYPLTINFIK